VFEGIGRLAERAAGNAGVSRRGFLGRLGRGALATAGVVGGLLLLFKGAQAGPGGLQACINKCCEATCGKGSKNCSCDPTGTAYGACYSGCSSRGF
jgi:hypothetical protein